MPCLDTNHIDCKALFWTLDHRRKYPTIEIVEHKAFMIRMCQLASTRSSKSIWSLYVPAGAFTFRHTLVCPSNHKDWNGVVIYPNAPCMVYWVISGVILWINISYISCIPPWVMAILIPVKILGIPNHTMVRSLIPTSWGKDNPTSFIFNTPCG